jgi:hypothetical protein
VKKGLSRRQLLMGALAQGAAHGQSHVHRKPKPLPKGAVTQDWAAMLGPSHNAVSTETMLSRNLPPPLVWEFAKGTGYASPAVAGDCLVFLHRLGTRRSSSVCTRKRRRASGSSDMGPHLRTGTDITTVHGRVRSSTASGYTQWELKRNCIAWDFDRGR